MHCPERCDTHRRASRRLCLATRVTLLAVALVWPSVSFAETRDAARLFTATSSSAETPVSYAAYAGPAYAPLLGIGAVLGIETRFQSWLATGVEVGVHDQSPLRTSITARALLITDYTFSFGLYGAARLGTGYRHVVVHGDVYRVQGGQAATTRHAGYALWSSSVEVAVGYDARPLGVPVRLSVAPGVHVSLPVLDGAGFDVWVTARLAWLWDG